MHHILKKEKGRAGGEQLGFGNFNWGNAASLLLRTVEHVTKDNIKCSVCMCPLRVYELAFTCVNEILNHKSVLQLSIQESGTEMINHKSILLSLSTWFPTILHMIGQIRYIFCDEDQHLFSWGPQIISSQITRLYISSMSRKYITK